MAITAVHAERGRLDATRADLGCGWERSAIHRVRPRVELTCPECRHGVHPKVSPTGLRFFAHDAGSPTCAPVGESMEHHLPKLQLATAARAAGWFADPEVRGPGGRWRADVLASAPDGGRRIAREAQLSAATADELRERTARFAEDGVTVCWTTTRGPWPGAVPSVRPAPPEGHGRAAVPGNRLDGAALRSHCRRPRGRAAAPGRRPPGPAVG